MNLMVQSVNSCPPMLLHSNFILLQKLIKYKISTSTFVLGSHMFEIRYSDALLATEVILGKVASLRIFFEIFQENKRFEFSRCRFFSQLRSRINWKLLWVHNMHDDLLVWIHSHFLRSRGKVNIEKNYINGDICVDSM